MFISAGGAETYGGGDGCMTQVYVGAQVYVPNIAVPTQNVHLNTWQFFMVFSPLWNFERMREADY